MNKSIISFLFSTVLFIPGMVPAADVVPNEIMQPGTQPNEAGNFESPGKCDNCHGGYDEARAYSNEPAFGWRGSAMGNAGRDPIFWATLAVAEQDFDGAGDLCIRCHSTRGWYAGRSTPTDGSGLAVSDDEGVDCDTCHTATNPDNSEHLGVMNQGFLACETNVAGDACVGEGYYGSGMLSLWSGSDKLGPYDNADARHQWMQSQFHRADAEWENICGSCHDVSNSAVGDLAPNSGTQPWADAVISSKDDTDCNDDGIHDDPGPCLGGPVEDKAAFNNPPYKYGVVERTFSEWKAGAFDDMDVRNFLNLPADLQVESGALNMAYQTALLAGGTYEDGTVRTFNCMGCHMRADIGEGCNKAGVLTRSDLPKHDLAGGNYWMWPLIKYQDQQGTLRLGGGLTQLQLDAMDAGQIRAEDQLRLAADLTVTNNTVKITNLTGHKLITGYPEGRRMWLNVKWYDVDSNLVGEDGAYGTLTDETGNAISFTNPADGLPFEPQSILDLGNTKVYEVHPAITREWAQTLIAVNPDHYGPMALGYDRSTGAPTGTIAQLANGDLGPYEETFHFVLNNHVASDNRIPPYGMDCEEARKRNALPVPTDQYGGPVLDPGSTCAGQRYQYWDEVTITPPAPTAVRADISLYYQGTSWEYIQFLWKANDGQNAFLGQEGVNMLDAWVNADPAAPMVPPIVMATVTWPACEPSGEVCIDGQDNDCDGLVDCDDVADCGLDPACCTAESEICDDGADNDCDGLIDCNDAADCAGAPICDISCDWATKEACNADPNCQWKGGPRNGTCEPVVACVPTALDEVGSCGDGIDNDCDGLTDCADTADCGNDPVCQVDCPVYTTRNLCRAQTGCRWDNKNGVCVPN